MSESKIKAATVAAEAAKTPEKFLCASCEYWRFDPAKTPTGRVIASNDNGGRERFGNCHLMPPGSTLFPVQSHLNPSQMGVSQFPHQPTVSERGTCAFHPQRIEHLLTGAIKFAVRYAREFLEYKPGKVPDQIAAGFSRIPEFHEALRFSVGHGEKPGEPLSAESANPPPPPGHNPEPQK